MTAIGAAKSALLFNTPAKLALQMQINTWNNEGDPSQRVLGYSICLGRTLSTRGVGRTSLAL